MLIYNNKKEFIGIDEIDLNKLGFSSLSELQSEATDFADLFIKEPGFIHNFEHVNWIDFVECSDTVDGAKALIQVNSRNFKCNISVSTAFLTQDPSSKAYLVHLNNMSELTDAQTGYVSVELLEKSIPEPRAKPTEKPIEKPIEKKPVENIIASVSQDTIQIDEEQVPTKEIQEDTLNIPENIKEDTLKEQVVKKYEVFDNGYIYDPLIASSELGLPVDLIEEFIEDFIEQAKDFKDGLYTSLDNGDNDNVKILSHKLKGVAANLRIEDALESLTIINTSDDTREIKGHLDTFYKIISKLSNEKTEVTETVIAKKEITIDEPQKEVQENNVPFKIDMPELADDDFLSQTTKQEQKKDEEKLETIEMLDDDIFNKKDIGTSTEDKKSKILEIDEIEDFELDFKTDVPVLESEPTLVNFNKEDIANEIGLDKESFNELLEDYLLEANKICTSISQAIETGDNENWIEQALKLKGMSDNMRIESFTEELDILINTTDKSIAQGSNKKIEESIKQISNMEN